MTDKEIEQKHLQSAVNHALAWFRNIPNLSHQVVCHRIVECITSHFRMHEIELTQFELIQVDDSVYAVTVNRHAAVTVMVRKEVTHD